MHKALDAIGQTYKDFCVTKYFPLEELRSTLIELVHEPTGAPVIHIANDDIENLFCLSFQTLPTSSNGVAHILEHTVLCGSKKFPVKDPFFAMTRRSLHTFMNALTGQDFTCYPASSQVEKDFYNLLEVYLDAVFFPELKQLSFLQEGHRLEWSEEILQFQGIVYNEMKGAMSCSESRLWQAVAKHLLPDLPYAYNSGGDPKEIPLLKYEELLEFHRAFYHPSRCLFFFYGNLPVTKHLDFLSYHAFKQVKKIPPLNPLPLQPRFQYPIRAVDFYPVHAHEDLTNKAQIAFVWLTAHLSEQSDVLALSLLESILLETDASLLKMALLKSSFCKEIDSSFDTEMSEVPFSIVCRGCNPKNEGKLQSLLFETLRICALKPIEPKIIEAAFHQLEFQRTEIAGDGGPFGLTLFMRAALLKQHGHEPEQALLIHSLFAALREQLKDPHYLPNVIRKYFLENRHFLTQVLLPDPKLAKREKEEEKMRLREISANLTEQEKEGIRKQTIALLKYQESVEHQSLDCLPKIDLHDIPPHPKDFPLTYFETKQFDVYSHHCFTNQILYVDFLFDLPPVELEDLPLISLLANIWTDLGCGRKPYEETLQLMQAHSGGINAHLALHVSALDPNLFMPSFSLRGKGLRRKAEPFFQLLYDFAKGPDFSDRTRLREWICQHATELEHDLASNALNYAIQLALSGDSDASFIHNQWHGLPYYQWIKQIAEEKTGHWMDRLSELSKRICTSRPKLILSAASEDMDALKRENFYKLGEWESSSKTVPWKKIDHIPKTESQIRLFPSPVAFTVLGFRTSAYRDPDVAELMLSTQLLDHVVLHKEVREKGGAYGSSASYAPTTGNYHLYSYRDPQLGKTLDIFSKAIDQIGAGQFSERDLEEAKISLIASMDIPVAPGARAIVAYAWRRCGRIYEARQKLRNEILSATKEQVAATVLQKIRPLAGTVVSFMGEDLAKKEHNTGLPVKELFAAEFWV